MSRLFGRVFGVLREIGAGIDAGHAIRLGLPVSESAMRHSAPHKAD